MLQGLVSPPSFEYVHAFKHAVVQAHRHSNFHPNNYEQARKEESHFSPGLGDGGELGDLCRVQRRDSGTAATRPRRTSRRRWRGWRRRRRRLLLRRGRGGGHGGVPAPLGAAEHRARWREEGEDNKLRTPVQLVLLLGSMRKVRTTSWELRGPPSRRGGHPRSTCVLLAVLDTHAVLLVQGTTQLATPASRTSSTCGDKRGGGARRDRLGRCQEVEEKQAVRTRAREAWPSQAPGERPIPSQPGFSCTAG